MQNIKKDDIILVGVAPNVEEYQVMTEPDQFRWCQIAKLPTHTESVLHTVYLGRQAVLRDA